MIDKTLGDFFMNLIDYNLIEKLKTGDFSNIAIDTWFTNYDFEYILALISGCDKKINVDILNLIILYAKYIFNHADQKLSEEQLKYLLQKTTVNFNINLSYDNLAKTWQSILIEKCEKILEQVIIVGLNHHEYYSLISSFNTHSSEILRVFYCANGNFSAFLNDPSPRVRKICHIREKFIEKWREMSEEEKNKIIFLEKSFIYGAIEVLEVGIPSKVDRANVVFKSLLFEEAIKVENFDWDILYAIQDKKILTMKLYEIINEKNIKFNEEMFPITLKNNLNRR